MMKTLLLVVVCVSFSVPALSQEAPGPQETVEASEESESARERARALFSEARRAREEGRLAESLNLLTRSLTLLPHRSTAMNLVHLHLAMHHPRLADALLAGLQAGEYGELDAAQQSRVVEMREETRRQLAFLHLEVESAGEVELRIDGVATETPFAPFAPSSTTSERSGDIELDPGQHVIWVESFEQHQEQSVDLRPGQRATLRFEFEEEQAEPTPPPRKLTWLWVTLGVLGAGAIATVVVVATRGDPSPRPDPDGVFDVIQALRVR